MATKKPGSRKKTSGAPARKSGNGEGWGGPARGAHEAKPAYQFERTPGPGRGHFTIAGEQRHEREARIAEEMRELLYGFATDDERADAIRLQASTKLSDRIEGLPVQKLVTQQADVLSRMTDQELEQAAAETRRRLAAADAAKEPDARGD